MGLKRKQEREKNKKNILKKKNIKIKIDMLCNTPWKQAWGLMFSKKKTALFRFKKPRRVAIHTWFMRYPLLLIFLNKKRVVVEIKDNMLPWAYYQSKNDIDCFIELPGGEKAQKIRIKDKIKIIKNK